MVALCREEERKPSQRKSKGRRRVAGGRLAFAGRFLSAASSQHACSHPQRLSAHRDGVLSSATQLIVMRSLLPSRVDRRRQREVNLARKQEEAAHDLESAAERMVVRTHSVQDFSGRLSNKTRTATAKSKKVELETAHQHALTGGSAVAASVNPQAGSMTQHAQCQCDGDAKAGGISEVARNGSTVQDRATVAFKDWLSLEVEALKSMVDATARPTRHVRNEKPFGPSFWSERGARIPLGKAWRELDRRGTENTQNNCFALSPSSSRFRRNRWR